VTVNTALSVTSFGITPTFTEQGVPTTITATAYWVGGTGPYTATLYSGSQSSCLSDTVEVGSVSGISATTYSFSSIPSPSSNTYYCMQITDSSTPPFTVYSSIMEFSVSGPLDPSTSLSVKCAHGASDAWTCTATLKGSHVNAGSYSVAGESIEWSQVAGTSGRVAFSSPTCTLSSAATCSVTVTGVEAGAAKIYAAYGGDGAPSFNEASQSAAVKLSVVQDRPILHVSCASTGNGMWTCTATLTGYAGSVAGENVTLSQISGRGLVSFSSTTCTLSSAGKCTFTIAGIKDGRVIIRATFNKNGINLASSRTFALKVEL
jgi:hypothetical protein